MCAGFGLRYSYVYIIFEDGTDLYWARSRTLEYLSKILPRLPQGVNTELGGRHRSGLGLSIRAGGQGGHDLAQLRSIQDWYLRYHLQSVPGVAEVAPLGGFVRQYQVNVDPNGWRRTALPISKVVAAVRGGTTTWAGGWWSSRAANTWCAGGDTRAPRRTLRTSRWRSVQRECPSLVRDVGTVTLGPDMRRGVADLDGTGEVVSGIVIMRQGENALAVIDRVKAKLKEIEPGLPPESNSSPPTTLRADSGLDREPETHAHRGAAVVGIVILIFLWHIPSAIIPILTIPIAVMISFLPMRLMGMSSNIMSLGGIAIAVAHGRCRHRGGGADPQEAGRAHRAGRSPITSGDCGRGEGSRRASFFALLVIAVSFLPVLTLEAQRAGCSSRWRIPRPSP